MVEIKVKRKDTHIGELEFTGDWVDVRASAMVPVNLKKSELLESYRAAQRNMDGVHVLKGDTLKIYHGFCLELPKGYEADLRPRGSLFKKLGLIFTASGVIDEGYNGDNDEWFSTFYATKDCEICVNERICQFRIQKKQPEIEFKNVHSLGNADRGGHGSTGDF